MKRQLILVTIFVLLLLVSDLAHPPPGDGLQAAPLLRSDLAITSVNATQLAAAMDIPAADLVSASLGTSDSDGVGEADAPLSFFPRQGGSYAILSTGRADSADAPDTNNNEVVGTGSTVDDISERLAGKNNTDGHDLVQLALVLQPPAGKTSLSFDFAFYSEEFPDWINSLFNDVFVAELAAQPFDSGLVVNGTRITAPANIAFDPNGESISVNAGFGFDSANPNPDTGTTYDGTSGLLRATGCLPEAQPTGNVVLILSITDVGDSQLDSAVFLDNFQWGSPAQCRSGAQQLALDLTPETATRPVDSAHTVTATVLDDQGDPFANQTIRFKATGANTATGQRTTNAAGQGTFSYTGGNAGQDTITAWIDTNGNQMQDGDEIFDTATITWQAPTPTNTPTATDTATPTATPSPTATPTPTPMRGALSIVKAVAVANDSETFGFSGDVADFTLKAGQAITIENLAPAAYRIVENQLPAHWELLWVQCDGQFLNVQWFDDPPGPGAIIPVLPSHTRRCIFYNERSNFEPAAPETIYLPLILK